MIRDALAKLLAELVRIRKAVEKSADPMSDVVSPTAAANSLPMRRERALSWLREKGLVHTIATSDGRDTEVVFMSEVREAVLADKSKERAPRRPPSRSRIKGSGMAAARKAAKRKAS